MSNEKTAIELITEERQEQINKHGWSAEHDDAHLHGQLAIAAAALAVYGTDAIVQDNRNHLGTYDDGWSLLHKLKADRIHQLKVAGALIAAELDRELRLLKGATPKH